MAILKFRAYYEEDDAIYRDIAIKHTQSFELFHLTLLKAWNLDGKHEASFYRSNENWQRGRAISIQEYSNQKYPVQPLIMSETTLGSEIKFTNQRFIYEYDFTNHFVFLVELIQVDKTENIKLDYPCVTRTEGIGPQQYGTKALLGERFNDIEEKYDLQDPNLLDGFTEENFDEHAD